ncbi:hypothetical protein A2U01_0094011, partial [Trifolium medium]|nr:hypothetical protein [Trifolium medium]
MSVSSPRFGILLCVSAVHKFTQPLRFHSPSVMISLSTSRSHHRRSRFRGDALLL